ncbi:MAG TPA: hypothetical protein VNV41_18890 [Candidatus Acidoferrales bacterium]|jgi:hypothetical protein|nr:hypothetical protein [Candidatus Acidoferrales bacterium]
MSTKVMTGLGLPFYETALEFTLDMAERRRHQLIRYPAAVIVLASTALDAYMNETLAFFHFMEHDLQKRQEIAGLRTEKLRQKWIAAPLLLGGTAFDASAEPFLSFDLMLRLRNKLVHYSAGFRTTSEYPLEKIEEYRKRFTFTHEGTADWTSQVLNLDCARWGCRTAHAMVQTFHKLSHVQQLQFWPDPA